MRLGLTLAPDATSVLDHAIELAVAAEQAGYETIYVTERHFDPTAGFANPYAVAAAISGRLQRAWLAVRPVLGLQHPLRLVEQANILDVLTRGRSLLVTSDDLDEHQYEAFGLPTPRNGLFEHLVEQMLEAWSWQFREDGPPLEFTAGPFSARMAGRIMPAPCRKPHPLLARESDSEAVVVDAARRGWPVQLRGAHAHDLVDAYRDALNRSDHSASTIQECLRWLVVVVDVTPDYLATDVARLVDQFGESGVAEVRLDPILGVSVADLIHDFARSA